MKKILVLMLCVSMMVVGLTACNNSNDEKDNDDKPKETKVSQETDEEKETDETEEKKEMNQAETEEVIETDANSDVEFAASPFQPGTRNILIDTPKNYMPINQGYTQMFNVGRDKSISFVFHLDHEPVSLENAHEAAFEKYIQGFSAYAKIDTLVAEKEEVIDINGREMYHYEGKINCIGNEKDYSLYCTGYSFIMDDIPVMVVGTVLEKEQPQEMIDEVKMYTDAMVRTVREAE